MIIQDGPLSKIDAFVSADGFVHLTSFRLKGEWVVKEICLSPETFASLSAVVAAGFLKTPLKRKETETVWRD